MLFFFYNEEEGGREGEVGRFIVDKVAMGK